MKKILLFSFMCVLLLGCTPKIDPSAFVPEKVDSFARSFIAEIKKGNMDTCLSRVTPEKNNDGTRMSLSIACENIKNISLESGTIIAAKMQAQVGGDNSKMYVIEYEFKTGEKYSYFLLFVLENNDRLFIAGVVEKTTDTRLSTSNAFNFNDKGVKHYLMLLFMILIPAFVVITLIAAVKTKLDNKWIWIVGILIGFTKIGLNWTTGEMFFQLLNFSLLGAGLYRSGDMAPWLLNISLPVVAVIFWFKRQVILKDEKDQQWLEERRQARMNQENNNSL